MNAREQGTQDAFSSFNARAVPASVLVKDFIPPAQFATLTRRAHTVVVGPRGSGKTTLLKMLTPEALRDSDHSPSLQEQPGVAFTGVFVPTDISWSAQLNALRGLGLTDEEGSSLVYASFTTAVLRAFVGAIYQRASMRLQPRLMLVPPISWDSDAESAISRLLASAWKIDLGIPSLLGVRTALSQRLVDISQFAAREQHRTEDSRGERFAQNDALHLPLLGALSAGLDCIEAAYPAVMGERWALLFDELELAPPEIRAELVRSLRSVDERFLFKLSISPFGEDLEQFTSALSAMPGHDHDEVSLSYGRKEDGVNFSLELMQAILRRRKHQPDDLSVVLGPSDFPVEPVTSSLETHQQSTESRRGRYFRALYRDDATFREYVHKHARGIDEFLSLKGDARAQFVRKVTPIVLVRSAFRIPDNSFAAGTRRYKTRKNPDIYRGFTSLATILEGNPRYIIGVMNELLDETAHGKIGGARQTAEISRAANRFRALLTTIPTPAISGVRRRGLLPIVDLLGAYFRERVVADEFTPDPIGSFVVDSHTAPEIVSAIGNLLNTGALVYVPDPGGAAILTSLRGKRFRLNYLLASQYGMPLRLEREQSISSILDRRARSDTRQPSIFEAEEPR